MSSTTTSSTSPAREAQPLADQDLPAVVDLAWYMSSFDLRSGLTVVELDFVETVPSALHDGAG